MLLERGDYMKNISNDKRAISAVISTVIIVAVTIAVAIAVAYWMGGLATIFTRFEKIEVKNAYVVRTGTQYKINITYINTGATPTSIDLITVNGVPWDSYLSGSGMAISGDFVDDPTCQIGVEKVGTISFYDKAEDPSGNILTSGVTATINIHTTGGKDYYTSVTLP